MAIRSLLQDVLLVALPAGGQQAARRHAWAGMSRDAATARARRAAEAAVAEAAERQRSGTRTGS